MLSIDISAIVVFAIVWILLALLNKVFFKPLRKVMGEREAQIAGDRKAGQKALEEYDAALLEIEEKINNAHEDAQSKRDKYLQEAMKEKEKMLAEITYESRSQVEKEKEKLKRELKRLKKELETKSEFLAKKIEQRIFH